MSHRLFRIIFPIIRKTTERFSGPAVSRALWDRDGDPVGAAEHLSGEHVADHMGPEAAEADGNE